MTSSRRSIQTFLFENSAVSKTRKGNKFLAISQQSRLHTAYRTAERCLWVLCPSFIHGFLLDLKMGGFIDMDTYDRLDRVVKFLAKGTKLIEFYDRVYVNYYYRAVYLLGTCQLVTT